MKYEYKAIPTLVNLPALERGDMGDLVLRDGDEFLNYHF